MRAIARSQRITSKKANLIADLVRLKNVTDAMNILRFTPKKGAKIIFKVVRSAVANAENNFKQERPSLFIREIVVTEGATLKRSVPVSRGRANPILKRTAHITVLLGVQGEEVGAESKIKKEAATAPTPAKETAAEAPKAKKTPVKKTTTKKKVTKVKA